MRSHEAELVATLRIPAALDPALLAARLDRSNHTALATLAENEGVAGLLYRDIGRADLGEAVDPSVLKRLQEGYANNAAANARRMAALGEVLAHPELLGTKVVVLKGMALIDDLYADWGLRPMTDIDLWVDGDGNHSLRRALVDLDYEAQPFYPDTFRRGSVSIDAHCSLLGSERISTRDRILADGETTRFGRALPFEIAGKRAWRLDTADTVLFACLHLLKHNACRMLWLLEVDALVAGWGADETAALTRRAGRAGQQHAVELVAFLANDLLAEPVDNGSGKASPPVDTSKRTSPPVDGSGRAAAPVERSGFRRPGLAALLGDVRTSAMERRALSRRRTKGKLPVWGPLVFFNVGGTRGGRARSAFETLFPRPATLRQIFEDDDSWLAVLYVRRFFRLVEMVVRH